MSEQEGPVGASQATSGRVEQFAVGVHALRVPNQSERLERRLYWVGIVLPVIGLVVVGLGWWGASGTKFVYQEIPYVISGGIFGIALVVIGVGLFAVYSVARLLRFWLARLVAEQQMQTDRVVEASERIADALTAQAAAIERLRQPDGDRGGSER